LRLDFPPKDESLKPIGWDEFFDKFEKENLAFLYQDKTATGRVSRFHKFVERGTAGRGRTPSTKSSARSAPAASKPAKSAATARKSSSTGSSSSKTSTASKTTAAKKSSGSKISLSRRKSR
jgi:hypothetical protein